MTEAVLEIEISDEVDCSEESAGSASLKFLPPHSSKSGSLKFLEPHGSSSVDTGNTIIVNSPSDDTLPQSSFEHRTCRYASLYTFRSTIESIFAKPPLTEVTSQLYFGSFDDAKNEEELRSREITHTISLIGPKHLIAGIEHKHNPMNDFGRTDLKKLIKNLWAFVEESQQEGKALFVHCMCGQNRSATVVIAILMRRHGKSLIDAFKIVKHKRPLVQINEQYAKQLSKMELELHGQTSVSKNWMEIRFADMETGKVVFYGDSILSKRDL